MGYIKTANTFLGPFITKRKPRWEKSCTFKLASAATKLEPRLFLFLSMHKDTYITFKNIYIECNECSKACSWRWGEIPGQRLRGKRGHWKWAWDAAQFLNFVNSVCFSQPVIFGNIFGEWTALLLGVCLFFISFFFSSSPFDQWL